MKKLSTGSMIMGLFAAGVLLSVQPAFAGDVEQTNAGDEVTLGDNFKFQPSPQVLMAGTSDGEAFVVGAVHNGSVNKANGEAYAMFSTASGLFVQSMDGNATAKVPELPAVNDEVADGIVGSWKLVGKE